MKKALEWTKRNISGVLILIAVIIVNIFCIIYGESGRSRVARIILAIHISLTALVGVDNSEIDYDRMRTIAIVITVGQVAMTIVSRILG